MESSIRLKCTLNRNYLPVDKKSVVYLAIDVIPPEFISKTQTLASAICLVIDRSSSMGGHKFQKAKAAARNLLHQLQPGDYVSLVTFSSKVEEIVPLRKVQDVDMVNLDRKIDQLRCGGGTELYRGLDAAYQQFLRSGITGEDIVKRVILLSDGQPDDNLPQSFYVRLAKEMGDSGVSVMALGIGDKYNEDLLSEIAEHSRGMWKHISTADDIPAIVSQQLEETRAVVAPRSQMVVRLADGVEIKAVYKFVPEALKVSDIKRDGSDITVPIGDITLGQPQTFVMQLAVAPAGEGERCLVKVQIPGEPASSQDIMVTHTSDMSLWGVESDAFPRGIFLTAETQVLAREGLSGDKESLARAKELAETILADTYLSIDAIHEATTVVKRTVDRAEQGLSDEETKAAKQDVTQVMRRWQ